MCEAALSIACWAFGRDPALLVVRTFLQIGQAKMPMPIAHSDLKVRFPRPSAHKHVFLWCWFHSISRFCNLRSAQPVAVAALQLEAPSARVLGATAVMIDRS